MGEQSVPPQENGLKEKQTSDNSDGDIQMDSDEDVEDMTAEDFDKLNSQLDALNSALDNIEQWNDNIQAQLMQLLKSNREVRQQLQVLETTNSENKDN